MKKRLPIFIGLLLTALALWMLLSPTVFMRLMITRLENIGYDVQMRTALLTGVLKKPEKIVIIDIDDKSLNAEGRWPWPRSKLAELIDRLNENGATIIAFDFFFAEEEPNLSDLVSTKLDTNKKLLPTVADSLKTERELFNEDAIFAKSLKSMDTILAISFLNSEQKQNTLPKPILPLTKPQLEDLSIFKAHGYISNIPILMQSTANGGFVNIVADNDGIFRHAPLFYEYDNALYASLALQTIVTYLGADISLVTPQYDDRIVLEGVNLNAQFIPTDAKGQVLIPFVGPSYTFPYYSATDVLNKKLPPDALLGKVVFVGTSASGLGDLKPAAIENPFPGVEIQASVANGLLENKFSYRPAWTLGANLILTVFFGLLSSFIFPYLGPRTHGFFIITLPFAMLAFNNWFWLKTGLIISFLIPVALVMLIALFNILYSYLFESRKRERIKAMFGQYVPEKHIDAMLQSEGNYGLRGEDREMSVLFADIRSFTTISEKMSATDLVEMLNTYFTPMTKIIFDHKGTIDKYVGDLIMAFWGAPLKDNDHSEHAILSALEMQAQTKKMKEEILARGWQELKIGIGINSGKMSVGDMGSQYRRNYTVLGDNVNLASRVESITKYYGVDIAVTEFTEQNQDKFIFRKLDRVQVKGKKEGVSIFEVICKREDMSELLKNELERYHHALQFYYQKSWSEAKEILSALHTEYPDRKIYWIYLERIKEFENTPPPLDWGGVFVHTSK